MKATILISSFHEPGLEKAILAALNQNTKINYEVVVLSPDKEAERLVKKYKKKRKNIRYIKDPGRGKSFALNLSFKKLKGDILVFTDGDVYLDLNALSRILSLFRDSNVGCVTGRVAPTNDKRTLTGYWAHLLAEMANYLRKKLSDENKFLECTGYLFAFRKGLISKVPTDVAEDSFIPYVFYRKGYRVKYVPGAVVYVKNPTTIRDFIKQRVRTAKAHSFLTKYFKNFPKVKSFKNEVKESLRVLKYPSNFKEFLYTLCLFFVRLYIWIRVLYEDKIIKKFYTDGWEKIKTTQ